LNECVALGVKRQPRKLVIYLLTYLLTYLLRFSAQRQVLCSTLFVLLSTEDTAWCRPSTRSSAAAEIARDADDVDHKFSEVTVHQTKKTPPNVIQIHPVLRQMICPRTPNSSNHARTQRRPCALRLLT